MHTYEAKKFNLPKLEGMSEESIKQHVGLYEGYVKNFNAISQMIAKLAMEDSEKYAHPVSELVRRRSFEFDGMRLHEHYFAQFEGGAKPISSSSAFSKALETAYAPKKFEEVMKSVASMRGPGWALLYYDAGAKEFLLGFSGEQHQGHFVTLPIILALDVWEHAFILDYGAQGKGKYIDAFFKNLNWDVVEKRFADAKA
jgi:Fe-Mn family superoxide dismutase